MITKNNLKQIAATIWEVPTVFRSDMKVPARIFTTEKMLEDILLDRSLEQLINVTTLPGIIGQAMAMPDIHEGYGFPIGGVATIKYPDGVISPGGIGYDINCGVRLLKSGLFLNEIKPYLKRLADEFARAIPSGTGRGGRFKITAKELDKILKEGVFWAAKNGYADKNDLENIESKGRLDKADPEAVSNHAKSRGQNQLGTLGSGNHFAEIDFVEEIFDWQIASQFGLAKEQIVVLIHTGSRGLGHQVATDYIKIMLEAMTNYGISLPDRELACAPCLSKEGTAYFKAMAAAANFAWVNRQLIAWEICQEWKMIFGNEKLETLYDVAHNIAKIEEHTLDNTTQKVIVHRKGATRAFGPGHPDLPSAYQSTGQPVLVPGSMGTASYILVGTKKAEELSFSSACHGAGRRMSRHQAKKEISGKTLQKQLEKEGIIIKTGQVGGLAEEAPFAYKNVHNVVDVLQIAGIAQKVARLKPLVVVKG